MNLRFGFIVVSGKVYHAGHPKGALRRCAYLEASATLMAEEEKQKGPGHAWRDRGLLEIIPAATYVPTQLPAQYHRPGEA